MLNERLGIFSAHNTQDSVVIDLQRGVVADSNAMDDEQYTRYFRKYPTHLIQRPDLNPRQAADFYRSYLLGERLLNAKRYEYNYLLNTQELFPNQQMG